MIPNSPNYFAEEFHVFQRAMRNILSIDKGFPTTVTTTLSGTDPEPHDYSSGLVVRLYIPEGFGFQQGNHFKGAITVISPTQFTLDLDSSNFDDFIVPSYVPGKFGTPAQVVPIGEDNDILTMATKNVLPYT